MHTQSYRYPLLNDKDWLYEHYITESLSTKNIRDIIGCKSANRIIQALIRHDITIRNISEGLTVNNVDTNNTFM